MEKVNILLVDDQPGKLLTYQAILESLGENLVLARSGREALQCLLKQDIALILLDVIMPEMDGFDTATLIRQHPRLEQTPIIFVTALSTSDLDRLKGYELGAVDYVFAPVVPEILRAKASAFVELYRKKAELQSLNRTLTETNAALLTEVAERKKAEEQIRTLNEQLEERVRQRTTQLQDALSELETFSYSVSHDLRAPLRSIDGFSAILLQDYGNVLGAEAQEFLHRMRMATQRMSQLIEALLNLARMGRLEMRFEKVNLSALAGTIMDELRAIQPERDVQFVMAKDLLAQGDPYLLRLVLQNLLSNAWKFSRKKPHARIEFGAGPAASESNGKPVYFVRDDGVGFEMAYLSQLFAPFQRLHRQDEFEGTGIGLATVQRIIRRHGGKIWAEGKLNEGATFYFTL